MTDEFEGAKVALRRIDDVEAWKNIDAGLADYVGSVRVFGFDAEHEGMAFRAGGYRLDGQKGLLAQRETMHVMPRFWEQTLFVFERQDEARHFRLNHLDDLLPDDEVSAAI